MINKIGAKSIGIISIIGFLLLSLLIQPLAPFSSIAVVLFIAIALLSSLPNDKKLTSHSPLIAISAPILGLIAISLAHSNLSEAAYLAASITALYAGHLYKPEPSKNSIVTIGLPLSLLLTALAYSFGNRNAAETITSNFAGAILLVSAFLWYAIANPKPKHATLWLAITAFILPTFTRSIILGIILSIFIVYFSAKSKTRLAISILILAITALFYLKFNDEISNIYQRFDLLSYTGKNLDTGRGEMWKSITESMRVSDFIIGGFDLRNVNELTTSDGKILSAHNGYLSMLASNGIIGVIPMILLPIIIIRSTYEKKSHTSKILAAYTIIFFVREIFEVSIHGNNFPIAGIFWFGTGLLIKIISTEKTNSLNSYEKIHYETSATRHG